MKIGKYRVTSAFTIVELLVVIVVIGVLAAITVVSYNGITKRATLASLQSDLSSASTKLKSYQTIYGSYPTLDANNCPSAPAVDSNYCLKFSPGNSIATTPFAGYIPNNSTTPQTFSLTLSSNDIQGIITESSKPSILTPAPLNPVADWIATPQGDHYGNYYDPVSKSWANVTRSTPKTIYDPTTQHIYDVPANYLAINPWSAYQPGGTGSAAVIEEARTNYLVNSYGAANNGSFWNNWAKTSTTINPVTTNVSDGVYGSTAQRLQYQAVTGEYGHYLGMLQVTTGGTFTAGETATASFMLKASITGSVAIRLNLYARQGTSNIGAIDNNITTIVTNDWTRYSVTYNTLPSGTDSMMFYLYVSGIDEGDSVDISMDAAQLEKGSFTTSYIPTTTVASTRNADIVNVPTTNWNGSEGSFLAMMQTPPETTAARRMIAWYKDASNRITLGSGANSVCMIVQQTTILKNPCISLTQPYNIFIGRWSNEGDTIISSYNSNSNFQSSTLSPLLMSNYLAYIGSRDGSAEFYNSPIQRLLVYSSSLSNSDVALSSSFISN